MHSDFYFFGHEHKVHEIEYLCNICNISSSEEDYLNSLCIHIHLFIYMFYINFKYLEWYTPRVY